MSFLKNEKFHMNLNFSMRISVARLKIRKISHNFGSDDMSAKDKIG